MKSKAREILDKDREFILQLFGGRCIRCGIPTKVIHEIVPISHGKSSLNWKNRIPLCTQCHDWSHSVGTNNSITILQKKRRDYIIRKFNLKIDTESE